MATASRALCLPKTADTISAVAKRDAKNFKLDNATWKLTRQRRSTASSDYFKPNKTYVRDTTLLRDSAYVTAFRHYAYKRNKHRRTTGHYILLGGEITVGIVAATLLALDIFLFPDGIL